MKNNIKKIKHNYQNIQGWFNMEEQYLELLENTPDNGIFVELGAWMGKSTSFIVTEIQNRNRNINFYTVDTFQGELNSSDENENKAYMQYDLKYIYEKYCENTKHLTDYTTYVELSDVAAKYFENDSVDTIFIDAGHSYESVIKDIQSWLPKMKNGSVMAGHDYNGWSGVGKAVRELLGIPDKVTNDCWFVKIIK